MASCISTIAMPHRLSISNPDYLLYAAHVGFWASFGFSHGSQHVIGTDARGRAVDRTVRVTDGYRKIGGTWLIALEHVSVPVDLTAGTPDVHSKP